MISHLKHIEPNYKNRCLPLPKLKFGLSYRSGDTDANEHSPDG